jgi:hypothetical protein
MCQGFGGVSTGPDPLRRLHADINEVLTPLAGKPITVTAIVDLMNMIGRCVFARAVRRVRRAHWSWHVNHGT